MFKLNRKYDQLEYTHPTLRFLIFMAVITPIAFIPNPQLKIGLLMCLIIMRAGYFWQIDLDKQRKRTIEKPSCDLCGYVFQDSNESEATDSFGRFGLMCKGPCHNKQHEPPTV